MRGKTEIKEKTIEYSPQELEEVERILNRISLETLESDFTTTSIPAETKRDDYDDYIEKEQEEQEIDSFLPESDSEEVPETDEDLEDISGFEEIPDTEPELEIETETPEEFQEEPEEMEEADDIPDITGIIRDIDESESTEAPETPEEIQDFEEMEPEDLLSEDFPLPADIEPEVELHPEELLDEDITTEPAEESIEELPDEFDLNMLDKEIGEASAEKESQIEALEELPSPEFEKTETELDESEPLIDDGFLEEYDMAAREAEESLPEPAIPDISMDEIPDEDFSIQTEEMPSVEETTAPETLDTGLEEADDFSAIDIEGLELPEELQTDEPEISEAPAHDTQEPDLSIDFEKLHEKDNQDKTGSISKDIDAIEPIEAASPASADDGIELSDSELKQLKKVIQFVHPNLTKAVKDVIINDRIPAHEIRELVNMLLNGKSEQEVKSFLEKKSGKKIDTSAESLTRRRVITSRPEYTREGRARQKRLFKITKVFGLTAIIAFLITILSYQYIYKPIMAKRNIEQGVQLIRRPGAPALQKQKDYKEAENIFVYVNENYIKDYLYGYYAYAKAYTQNKEFDSALQKLNKAYEIDSSNVDTLNHLGLFYSKLPEHKFKQIKPDLKKYYYSKVKPVGPVDNQVDVAIDFYKKSLNIDPKNVTALYGIGNAYINQGQNRKAREYFENILKIDKQSVIGYSGLLNLYIERDALPDIITIHSDLTYKEKLSQLPSPLLAKLAAYYLSKKTTDDRNIRIDYGIQSTVIKDLSDNPYPAVKDVLNALSARDIDYPPLFILFAKLSEQEGNLNLMKRNLLTALEKEPNYFAANLLLGKYYYLTKEPVEAYRYCKKAVQSYLTPPDFVNEDFFHETENIGHAHAIMGNIFYYYFDKMKFRFGDEFEDDNIQEQTEKIANYEIAQEKYEKAFTKNYKSSEIIYNLGRIYYIKGQYDKAITTWLNLYEDFLIQPELMFALGNAFYHQNNLEAGKGEFLKVISIFEDKEEKILNVIPGRIEHTKIYQTLSSAYNNLGAVYQIQNKETKSNVSYWRSIEYAKKIERENAFARVNLARAFKPGRENVLPVLDESIPESIEAYKETVR